MAKILVVDDAEVLRMELYSILSAAGHIVVEGNTGIEGLMRAKEHPDLDLIVTDLNMPEMDGITMCRKIIELSSLRNVPSIMLTSESTPEIKAMAKEAGVKMWLLKPFIASKLLQSINKVLELFPKNGTPPPSEPS